MQSTGSLSINLRFFLTFQLLGQVADTVRMSIALFGDVFTLALMAIALLVVGLRRAPTRLHWQLLGLMGTLVLWAFGHLLTYLELGSAWDVASVRLMFVGVVALPVLWLIVASETARVRLWKKRRLPLAALFAPPLIAYLALLTNDAHYLFIRPVQNAAHTQLIEWAGPICWASLAWGTALIVIAVPVYMTYATKLRANGRGFDAWMTGLASVLPLMVVASYFVRTAGDRVDFTPPAFAVSIALLVVFVLRGRLSRTIPIGTKDVIRYLRDGVVLASPDGEVLACNSAAEELFQGKAVHDGSLSLRAFLAELGTQAEALFDALRSETPRQSSTRKSEFDASDGRRIEVSLTQVCRQGGALSGWFAVFRDRTQERQQQELLIQTQKLETIGILSAGLAHEINNPLAYVRANLCYLQDFREVFEKSLSQSEGPDAQDLNELDQILEETLEGVERISKLVDNLRRFSRLPETANECVVDLNQVVASAIVLAELHRHGSVRVTSRLEPGLPHILASEERLNQVVVNLLVNAKQALADQAQGLIVVSTRSDGEWVELCVADDGPGISEHLVQKIFEPFFTTKGPDEGTGLGLAITHEIIREHGGRMEVKSKPGEGACFIARFPAAGSTPHSDSSPQH